MNTIDLLLGLDSKKIEKPTREVEIKRLSALANSPVIFKCQAVDSDTYSEIQQNAINLSNKGEVTGINMGEMQTFMILGGVIEPSLKDKALMSHYGAVTPKELVSKLLLPGEVTTLFNVINELSGFGEGAVEDIKN
jgi:hypothetical protein